MKKMKFRKNLKVLLVAGLMLCIMLAASACDANVAAPKIYVIGDHRVTGIKADGTVVGGIGYYDYEGDAYSWTNIAAVDGGLYHTVGLKADGTVVVTGAGGYDVSDWNLSESKPASASRSPKDEDVQAVNDDKAALIWDAIKNENTSQEKVTSNLTLLPFGENVSKISWTSSDTETISDTGEVTPPTGKAKEVTLTAVVSKGKANAVVEFNLTVTAD